MYSIYSTWAKMNIHLLYNAISILCLSCMPFQYSNAVSTTFTETKLEEQLHCSKEENKCYSLQQRMGFYNVPGLSIAVVKDGKIAWAKGYGVQDLESKKPVTNETLFQACSISKPVTALAILKLIQDGKLQLDQDVNEILKGWNIPQSPFSKDEAVTIRKLLNHTAGFATGRRPMMPLNSKLPSTIEILKGIPPSISNPIELEFVPGSKWQYSGAGYTILQLILEEYYHQSFSGLMKKQVLHPLNLKNSSYLYPASKEMIPFIAHGHTDKGISMEEPWFNISDLAAGGLWTTPTDLAKFVIEIQQANKSKGKVLTAKVMKEMLASNQENFGLGLRLGGSASTKWFGHGGDNAGYKVVMLGFLEIESGAVVMTNSDSGWQLSLEVLKRIGEIHFWPIPAPELF